MITDKMKELIATHIKNTLVTTGDIGMGGNSSSPSSSSLDVPLGLNITPSVIATNSNTIEVKLSIPGSSALMSGKVIREAGFFNSSNLLSRVNFDGVGPFASNETLEIFFIIEVE